VAVIEVRAEGSSAFSVRVEARSFAVTAAETLAKELGAPDQMSLVRASFEFLLERERVAEILPRFDLTVIARYFPEWREEMRRRWR
jgi:hypothetical protein